MTTVYLPYALDSREPSSSSSPSSTPHYRNFSTASTLSPGLSEASHPTEPLLSSNVASKSLAYPHLLSQPTPHPIDTQRGWIGGLSFDGDPVVPMAGSSYRDHAIGPRLRWWLRLAKGLLEAVIAAWAAYNATRYFLVFKKYQTNDGQLASLVLGISTGAAFAFSLSASISSLLRPYLPVHFISTRSLWLFRVFLRSLASSLLIGAAVVNVVLLFIWHNPRIPELNVRQHCHLDIDVLWSTFDPDCKPTPWGSWLAASLVRLVLTFCILISYHMIESAHHRLRKASLLRQNRRIAPPSMTVRSGSSHVIPARYLSPQHKSSHSTLQSTQNSNKSSSTYYTPGPSFGYSDDDFDPESLYETHSKREPDVPQDRFNSLISQITRETEDGLALAISPESSPTREPFILPYIPPAIGYDEFGRPYPPDETLFVFNGVVRRMPTIESMGSRELGSTSASSAHHQNDQDTVRNSPVSSRANTLMSVSDNGSHGPVHGHSRSNSLASGAEILLAMGRTSEVGELVDSGGGKGNGTGTTGTDSSYPSSVSYYTASSYRSGVLGPRSMHSAAAALFGPSGL